MRGGNSPSLALPAPDRATNVGHVPQPVPEERVGEGSGLLPVQALEPRGPRVGRPSAIFRGDRIDRNGGIVSTEWGQGKPAWREVELIVMMAGLSPTSGDRISRTRGPWFHTRIWSGSNLMNVISLRQPIATVKTPWLLLGVFENETNPVEELEGTAIGKTIEQLRSAKELTGTLGELTAFYEPSGLEAGALLVVGLGKRARFDAGTAFSAGFTASKRLAVKSRESVAIILPPSESPTSVASAIIEGAVAGTRSAGLRKTEPNRQAFGTLGLIIPTSCPENLANALESSVRRGAASSARRSTWRATWPIPPPRRSHRSSWRNGSSSPPRRPGLASRPGTKSGSSKSDSAA